MQMVSRAVDLMRIRDYSAARGVLEKALERSPHSFPVHRELISLLARKDPGAARERYRRLAGEHPGEPVYLLGLSLLADDLRERKSLIERALDHDPDYSWALLELAKTLDEAGEHAEAEELLRSSDFGDGASEEARFLLAGILAGTGRAREAVAAYEELAEAATEERTRERALEGKFDVLLITHRGAALSFAGELLAHSENPILMSTIGYDLADSAGTYGLAIELFERAVAFSDTAHLRAFYPAADPLWLVDRAAKSRGFYLEMIGELNYELGEDEAAIMSLERARSELSDPVKEILSTLARSYTRAGRPEEAIDVLLELLAKESDPGARALLDTLYEEVHGSLAGLDERIARAREEFFREALDFTLEGEGGAPVSLRDFRGEVVLLAFWFPT